MNIHFEINETNAAEWDKFLATSSKGHLLQSSSWGQLKSEFGWESALVTIRQKHDLVAGAQILFRPLPVVSKFKKMTIAYVPKGPVVDFQAKPVLRALIKGMDQLCKQHGAIFLKIEPDEVQQEAIHQTLISEGFQRSQHAIQPLSTILIDLRPQTEEILAQMTSKTRYNVRLANRKGVKTRRGSENDIRKFYELAVTTGQRDKFAIHEPNYYQRAYRLFSNDKNVQVFIAEFEEKLLASLLVFTFGDKAWYLYGASSNQERQRMPNHALQWAAINWAKDQGCISYDLWGIPDEAPRLETDPERLKVYLDDPPPGTLWGVYRFKRGFGGQSIRYIGAYDRVYSPLFYWLYERIMKRKQGLSA